MRISPATRKTADAGGRVWNRAGRIPTCAGRAPFGSRVGTGLWGLLLVAGCASQVETQTTVTLEQPQVKNGVILEEEDPAKLKEMAAALDALDLSTPDANAVPAPGESARNPSDPAGVSPPRLGVTEAVDMTVRHRLPADTTRLISLPKLSRTEINEITERLALSLESERGYVAAAAAIADALPAPPAGILGDRTLARSADAGTHVLRFGCRYFVSQPPQLWVLAVIVGANGTLSPNEDLAQIEPKVTKVVASLQELRTGLTVRDLEARLIQLSYVDAAAAMSMLKGFGITTLDQAAAVPPKIEFANLPYVASIKDPEGKYTGLVGVKTKAEAAGTFKLSMAPGAASELEDNTIASPMTQLLVLFHPAHPEQYSEVRRLLDTFIDRPARQIFIEAMVLEISEQGLRDLGVEWELNENQFPLALRLGSSAPAGTATNTVDLDIPDTSKLNEVFEAQFKWDWQVMIKALVRSGKAEILSRPSVLTLDNRQSTIRVGEDIPIASSVEGGYSGGKVGLNLSRLRRGLCFAASVVVLPSITRRDFAGEQT